MGHMGQKVSAGVNQGLVDLKTDTRGIITVLVLIGVITIGFLVFAAYYGILWTPGKPWDMMQ